ncbi:alpha/beta fold hydrolase [Streptomyces sp. DSM 41269]|uniref:alpha/beta fold hydrolase n=1 Tax=Streptomyces sp. DSM 41269 TaxID=2817709 RepID=UPI003593DC1E
MADLSGRYRVIAPDLRGFGASGRAASGYDAGTLAEDAAALLTALGVDSAAVVGIDAGTPPAFLLALRHPPPRPAPGCHGVPGGQAAWRRGLPRGRAAVVVRLPFRRARPRRDGAGGPRGRLRRLVLARRHARRRGAPRPPGHLRPCLHRPSGVELRVLVLPGPARERGTDRAGGRHCPPDGADDGAGRPARRRCAGTPAPPGHRQSHRTCHRRLRPHHPAAPAARPAQAVASVPGR